MNRARVSQRRRLGARRTVENQLRRFGFSRIAGVDEVGRGCLAGPVMAAAVVLGPGDGLRGLRDSKLLTSAARGRLYDEILASCLAWSVGTCEPEEIDRINIHHASLEAMRHAVCALSPLPDFVLVDGFRIPNLFIPQRGIVGGDRRCAGIAAASIVAKVTRDRRMLRLHEADPRYGFDRHKGYATADHVAAMSQHGYSAAHRRSFRPHALFDTSTDSASVARGSRCALPAVVKGMTRGRKHNAVEPPGHSGTDRHTAPSAVGGMRFSV